MTRTIVIIESSTFHNPVVYKNGKVKRILFEGGYATFAGAGKGADVQPYKFGGKELDAIYGLPIQRIDPLNSRWRSVATPPDYGLYNFDF